MAARTFSAVTEPLTISVVIPTLNERDSLERALVSTAALRVERIVVDGGSRDGTLEAARALGADLCLALEPGRARQMAAGAGAASGDALLFLHADTRLEAGWERALRACLADPGVAGGAFRLRFDSERRGFRWVEGIVRLRSRLFGLPYGDQALFVRRDLLQRAGGIRDVPIFEDLDLVRLIRANGRLALLPQRAWTSARRYERNGLLRTLLRNTVALFAWRLRLPRERVARWYRGLPAR